MRGIRYFAFLFAAMVALCGMAEAAKAEANTERSAMLREIPFSSIEGVSVGNAQDDEAKTGVTVFCFRDGAKTGVDISGGGPASRETPVLDPTKEDIGIHAIVLSGGSAYGLAASDGVMRCLEEHGIGFETGYAKVPLVVQSCIYDLCYGRADVRPDAAMGYAACEDALAGNHPVSGVVGGGTGATVGTLITMKQSTKSGIGYYAVEIGALKMGAAVIVNSWGDIYDTQGEKIAGLMNEERTDFLDSAAELYRISTPTDLFSRQNTVIGVIVTNGRFDKAQLTRIARQASNAYARCINPVGTLADGDTVYVSSCGKTIEADVNMAGTLAAEVMAHAIENALRASNTEDAEHLPYCVELEK